MCVRRNADVGRAERCWLIAGGAVVPHGDMILPTKSVGNNRIFQLASLSTKINSIFTDLLVSCYYFMSLLKCILMAVWEAAAL